MPVGQECMGPLKWAQRTHFSGSLVSFLRMKQGEVALELGEVGLVVFLAALDDFKRLIAAVNRMNFRNKPRARNVFVGEKVVLDRKSVV